ncbi:hypothetical protein [Allomuricauda sp. SCSIO 65647]|uniref:hypothetical protein n=1 Tax=Allomuricauda sp. SCSIO 65647 TaxID=2908843 RepID=UPI001F1A7180|nr:hypothetical protein [Muricauda sp. SCSIO 65647]UJH68439.1 hypothetical protein L0P89_04330 [Muricauda sp. SCSIO 65647]
MGRFLYAISYVFHPLLVPITGTLAYFLVTPKLNSLEEQSGNILPIFILTVIIPIIFFFILKNLGVVHSIFAVSKKERSYALSINIILFLMILLKVIPQNYIGELYYFFMGLVTAYIAALLLLLLGYKTSIHMLGMASLLMYLIGLSIHFEVNITLALGGLVMATGLVATSRLYMRAHSWVELVIGFILGSLSQLLVLKFWL